MDQELYREHILDHNKNPRYKRELAKPTFTHKESNPLCGDEITFYVELESNNIKQLTFTGYGCAISQAGASILAEFLQDKTLGDIDKLDELQIQELLGIPISVNRVKCALLSYKTIKEGLRKAREEKLC